MPILKRPKYKLSRHSKDYKDESLSSSGWSGGVSATCGDPGEAHIEGRVVPEEEAFEHCAKKLLEAKVPTIFPGPLVLWEWNDHVADKAKAIRELANEVPMRLIPMADYRPKYPKINAEVEINPNHPNLTIWHNKIDVCI
ncbi:MAG: carbon monoxide dehydrogenase beta subunit family protein, partial [Nitrospinaceae bacterium]|nr:carbon monoxide dehydrogenase beta subunit family protein [Nitrospinaceae bacterium]